MIVFLGIPQNFQIEIHPFILETFLTYNSEQYHGISTKNNIALNILLSNVGSRQNSIYREMFLCSQQDTKLLQI